jgi:hypothetical protein
MSGLTDAFAAGLLQGTTLEVQTAVLPPQVVDLGSNGDASEQSWAVRLLKPLVILRRDGIEVARVAPAGEPLPDEWHTAALVVAAVVALLVVAVVLLVGGA